MDQNKLLECMEDIKRIAQSQDNHMTKEELHRYLSEMDLQESQFDAVYQYLAANGISVAGFHPAPVTDSSPEAASADTDMAQEAAKGTDAEEKTSSSHLSKAERNIELFRREVSALDFHSDGELAVLWNRFLSGNDDVRGELAKEYLDRVFAIADSYKKHGIALDEMIAEGNVGLMMALKHIREDPGKFRRDLAPDLEQIRSAIDAEIRLSVENVIDSSTMAKDWMHALLAKTNLLREAAKYLAEENGHAASIWELAEYTKLPLSEIHDIMGLSEDTKNISKEKSL